MFVTLGMGDLLTYRTDFETPYLAASRRYYEAWADRYIEEMCTKEYIGQLALIYSIEKKRASDYLDSSTTPKLIRMLDDILVFGKRYGLYGFVVSTYFRCLL